MAKASALAKASAFAKISRRESFAAGGFADALLGTATTSGAECVFAATPGLAAPPFGTAAPAEHAGGGAPDAAATSGAACVFSATAGLAAPPCSTTAPAEHAGGGAPDAAARAEASASFFCCCCRAATGSSAAQGSSLLPRGRPLPPRIRNMGRDRSAWRSQS